MDVLEQIAALPGSLTIGGKTYPIAPPTPGDMLREGLHMKQLARKAANGNPLEYVAANASLLSPAGYAVAIAEAVKAANAPPGEPSPVSVHEQYGLPDGVRWRLWYHVNRSGGAMTEAQAKKLVTDFNCGNVCVALDDALKLPDVGEKKVEALTGTGG